VLGGEGVDDAGGHGAAKAAGDEGGGAESDLTVELLGPAVGGGGGALIGLLKSKKREL